MLGYAPSSAVLLVGAFLVFLLFRPYQGIIHDARLYVGYAMAAIDPEGIGRDIVFVNDGQSKFSVYPLLMRSLAEWVGPSRAAMALTYCGLTLWFAAFAALVRRLLDERFSDAQVIAVIVLAASLPSFYGGQGVFRFAEHFATPRAFAEASVLAAIAAMLAGRMLCVAVALGIGMAFHPLMTAPGLGVALWYTAESPRARRLLVLLGVTGTVVLIAGTLLLDVQGKPFGRFDAEWMAAINTKHALVFLRTWRGGDVIRILLHVVTVALAMPLLSRSAQRLVSSVLIISAAGVIVSFLGGDLAHNVLVTQGQAWRGLWVMAAVATVLQGVLLHAVWRDASANDDSAARDLRRAASLLLLLAWYMVEINSTALTFTLLAASLWALPRVRPGFSLPHNGATVVGGVAMVLIVAVVAVQAWVTSQTAWSSPDRSMRWAWYYVIASGIPALVVLLLLARGLRQPPPSPTHWARRLPTVAAVVALALIAVSVLDARSTYQRYVERELDARARGAPAPIRVARGSTVLWPYADLEPWAFAGAPGWGTIVQGIPSVFDRELAIMWASRTARLRKAGLLPLGQTGAETIAVLQTSLGDRVIASICAQSDPPFVAILPRVTDPHLAQASTFRPMVSRPLYPSSMGQSWGSIEAYSAIRC